MLPLLSTVVVPPLPLTTSSVCGRITRSATRSFSSFALASRTFPPGTVLYLAEALVLLVTIDTMVPLLLSSRVFRSDCCRLCTVASSRWPILIQRFNSSQQT
uniref:Uncharacterized protein n=1 Tax=Anopheles darlingi TaxID=43151 RepID=A0A2M4DLE6_ANODA